MFLTSAYHVIVGNMFDVVRNIISLDDDSDTGWWSPEEFLESILSMWIIIGLDTATFVIHELMSSDIVHVVVALPIKQLDIL